MDLREQTHRPSSWRAFLRAHWEQIAATNLFSTEVWTPIGLRTHYVLFVIDLSTRRAQIAGITTRPSAAFMAQVARNLTDSVDGFLLPHRHLICDRDTKFTEQFRRTLRDAGVEILRTPRQAPNCNAYAEHFVRTIKSECLSRMMLVGEAGLRHAVANCVEYYNRERPHQGLGNEVGEETAEVGAGPVECTERLGQRCERRQTSFRSSRFGTLRSSISAARAESIRVLSTINAAVACRSCPAKFVDTTSSAIP